MLPALNNGVVECGGDLSAWLVLDIRRLPFPTIGIGCSQVQTRDVRGR